MTVSGADNVPAGMLPREPEPITVCGSAAAVGAAFPPVPTLLDAVRSHHQGTT